jgi:hypothetical protein
MSGLGDNACRLIFFDVSSCLTDAAPPDHVPLCAAVQESLRFVAFGFGGFDLGENVARKSVSKVREFLDRRLRQVDSRIYSKPAQG